MRTILDEVSPEALQYSFAEMFAHLKSSNVLAWYRCEAANGALIVSVDGVAYFSSSKVHCPHCTVKEHRDGTTTYSHAALCAVIVHPQKTEVFPLGIEPILRQDGSEKNDCERNAAKRLLEHFRQHYASEKLLFVEDALYANAPHIRHIQQSSPQWQYLLAIKPLSHTGLFERFAQLKKNRPERTASHQHTDTDGTRYRFEYANDLALSESATDIHVNVLHCTATTKKGKTTTFTWITNIKLTRTNVYALMKAGRARWKIENETFNTLKNQGYHFEHNYGHGTKHLSSLLATLMLLAFLVDQMQAAADTLFKKVTAGLASKMKFWEVLRAVFKMQKIHSMHDAFRSIADSYDIQLE
jgi:hypothetical protein